MKAVQEVLDFCGILRDMLELNHEQALSFCIDYGSITQIEYFLKDDTARIMYVNR
jgi:hypothetical protein